MEKKKTGVYYGESSRLIYYERIKEHVHDTEGFKEGIFTILRSFKDYLSRKVAEAVKIHYTNEEILNSKNEYNSHHLSRVVVEEDAYERKRKARQEVMEEVMEKRKWKKFKAEHRRKPKRKPEEDDNIPTGWKRKL
jgi:hypothetical protein